jgi:multidrug efflux system membrane fusion protein
VGLIVTVIAAGAGAYYYFFQRGDKPAAEVAETGKGKGKGKGKAGSSSGRPIPIIATPVTTADVGVYLTGLGSVTPLATVVVRSRVDGQLMRLHYREGQLVKARDLLAEIDPRPFQVQLGQAEGQLAKDQAALKNAILDLERYRTLFQQDSIAKQQLDTQAALVRQFEGTIKADQATVESAKLQLAYSRVTAPITGRIGLRQVDVGNIVRAGDANGIVVITQLQPISVLFTVPEDNVSTVMQRLKEGKLPVDAWDRADKTKLASGALTVVDNQIDPATGTVKLRAQFANDDFALFPNQFVNARMLLDTLRGATVVPSAAVQRGSQGTFVYVVREDSTVTVRPVKLGPVQGQIVAVESGLTPGERVVTDGADRLREGARVEIADRTPRPEKAGKGRGKGRGAGEAGDTPGKGRGAGEAGDTPGKGKGGGEGKSGGESTPPVGDAKGGTTKREGAATPAAPPSAEGAAPRERGKGEARGRREGETDEERERRRAEWRNKSDAEKAEWRKKREEQKQ